METEEEWKEKSKIAFISENLFMKLCTQRHEELDFLSGAYISATVFCYIPTDNHISLS